MQAIKTPITATSGAAMCSHSSRVTRSPPMMCGPMSRIASKIDKYIPAAANAANHVKTRIKKGTIRGGESLELFAAIIGSNHETTPPNSRQEKNAINRSQIGLGTPKFSLSGYRRQWLSFVQQVRQ